MNPLAYPCTKCGAAIGAPCTVTMRHGNELAQCCAPHESRGRSVEYRRWTLHGCGDAESLQGFFVSLPAALAMWDDEGNPEGPNGPPSATEHRMCGKSVDSVRTVALRR